MRNLAPQVDLGGLRLVAIMADQLVTTEAYARPYQALLYTASDTFLMHLVMRGYMPHPGYVNPLASQFEVLPQYTSLWGSTHLMQTSQPATFLIPGLLLLGFTYLMQNPAQVVYPRWVR
jgi:hypothetical protein